MTFSVDAKLQEEVELSSYEVHNIKLEVTHARAMKYKCHNQ